MRPQRLGSLYSRSHLRAFGRMSSRTGCGRFSLPCLTLGYVPVRPLPSRSHSGCRSVPSHRIRTFRSLIQTVRVCSPKDLFAVIQFHAQTIASPPARTNTWPREVEQRGCGCGRRRLDDRFRRELETSGGRATRGATTSSDGRADPFPPNWLSIARVQGILLGLRFESVELCDCHCQHPRWSVKAFVVAAHS